MEKNKYQRATKSEKQKAREEFFKTPFGIEQKKRLNRLIIYSILLIACAIYFIIDNILNDNYITTYILSGIFVVVSTIFLYGRHYVIVKDVNNFMIKNPRRK